MQTHHPRSDAEAASAALTQYQAEVKRRRHLIADVVDLIVETPGLAEVSADMLGVSEADLRKEMAEVDAVIAWVDDAIVYAADLGEDTAETAPTARPIAERDGRARLFQLVGRPTSGVAPPLAAISSCPPIPHRSPLRLSAASTLYRPVRP